MSKTNLKVRLQNLLAKELSSSSNDKNQVISAYNSLIDILQIPQISEQLRGNHEILFQCISQIILTQLNQFLDDDQLQQLLEKASNACVLSMSQNQIIDGWLLNIEERTFEKPDNDEEEDDDDDLYEDATESEEEEEEKITPKRGNNRGRGNQHEQKRSLHYDYDSKSVIPKEISPPVSKPPVANQRNAHVAHVQSHRGGHQNSERSNFDARPTRGGRGNPTASNTNRGRRAPPFDNKYGVDLSLYDCYICGEYGHVQYDCPKKQDNHRNISRGGAKNKKPRNRVQSSSSSSSIEVTRTETDQNKLQHVYNLSSKLLNSSQTPEERKQTFEAFISSIETLEKQHRGNLSKPFREKESNFYSLFCHIAQNDFLFTNEQYAKLYHYKNILLPEKLCLLNEDRSIFSRQRILIPLDIITEHIRTVTQIQQTIFNDFQEYIIRSTSPISKVLHDLVKSLLKSNAHIDVNCLENFTKRILFDSKKSIFSTEQIDELQSCFSVRTKRFQRNNQKQTWKERLNLFKKDQLTADLNQWIDEFEQILTTNDNEQNESSTIVVEHAMWYFGVLIMASSGHLNAEQYGRLLNCAIQSGLFNSRQRFYFQVYLNQGQAPITIKELNQIKIQLKSENLPEKESAYEQIRIILDRPKPDFDKQSSPEVNDLTQSKQSEDIIPIIDNHVLSRLITLVEMICSDTDTFSMEQCKELLDKILQQSSIVRPLPQPEQNRLTAFYSRPISLSELKKHCLTIPSDLNDFISLLKTRIMTNNDEIFDFLTEIIMKIIQNRRKYSNNKCQELKSLIEKRIFGKKRYQLINEIYQKHRVNTTDLCPIDPIILNQFLTKILAHDYQAHLEFFTLLEELCHSMNFNEITIEVEINRSLLSTIILVITEADFSNSTNVNFFRQRLRTILENQTEFFLLLLTEQQFQLISSRLTSTSKMDSLIDLIKTDFNEANWKNLIGFIQNELNDKDDFQAIVNFVLETFDKQILSIERTLQMTNLIIQHTKLNNKSLKNLLEFLLDLLRLNIYSSPKVFLKLIEHNQENKQTIDQIIIILNAKNGKHAIADWKKTMIQVLKLLFDRLDNHQQLINIAQQSPMFQMPIFKQQLEACWKKTTDENHQASAVPNTAGANDQSGAHREMFRCLESNDPSMNALVVEQLRAYLTDERLSSEISLSKFIQALQIIFRNSQKFTNVSLDEWSKLIAKNRGKIFPNDAQCDEILLNILFVRLNMPMDTLKSLQRLIQSKKAHERHEGLEKLLALLSYTQMSKDKSKTNHLPTVSEALYELVTRVIFDQKFNDTQVRKCLVTAKNSWLLNNDHRQKLNL